MSPAAETTTSGGMPAPTPFSYAQAAMGRKPATTTPQTVATTATPMAPNASQKEAAAGAPALGEAAVPKPTSNGIQDEKPLGNTDINDETINAAGPASVSGSSSCAHHDMTAPSSVDSRRDDDDTNTDISARRSETGTRAPSATRHTSEEADLRRNKRGKKPKSGEKESAGTRNDADTVDVADPPEARKKELSEAPIPEVNVWLQRREAQLAKTKQTTVQPSHNPSPVDISGPLPSQTPQPQDNRTKSHQRDTNEGDISKAASKHLSGANGQGPRGGDYFRQPSTQGTDLQQFKLSPKQGGRGASDGPAADSSSWPTPDTANANQEERRKSTDRPTEKTDKDGRVDAPAAKGQASKKKTWVQMDFVPTVNFETPIPHHKGSSRSRGGARGGRDASARGGHGGAGTRDGDRTGNQPSASSKANGDARDRRDAALSRANSVPPLTTKRASLDGPSTREQRKPSAPTTTERSKEFSSVDQNQPGRDRLEGRGERRGAQRGRGGYHASTPQINTQQANFTNGYSPQGTLTPRQPPPYSPSRQTGFNGGFPHTQGGRSRGNGRSNSGQSRPSMVANHSSRVAPIQTQGIPYDFAMQQPLSAVGYQQPQSVLWDPLLGWVIQSQIDYYFSVDNLCKDVHLRKNMDSQGFVLFSFVAGFRRMQELVENVPEPTDAIRMACLRSENIDYFLGDDGQERLRMRDLWQQFVLPMHERFPAAQTDGPRDLLAPPYPRAYIQAYMSPAMGHPNYSMTSPTMMGLNGNGAFPSFPPPRGEPFMNGGSNGHGLVRESHTQLSATVPEFSPIAATTLEEMASGKTEPAASFAGEDAEHARLGLSRPMADSPSYAVNGASSSASPANNLGIFVPATAVNGIGAQQPSSHFFVSDNGEQGGPMGGEMYASPTRPGHPM